MPCPWWKRRSGRELEPSFRILVSEGRSQEGAALRALKKMDLNEDEDVLAMLKGSQFCKIRSLKWHKVRFYRLQEDCMSVWFQRRFRHPKSHHIFSLQHIEAVRQGHQSEGLRRYGGAFPSSCCLTITFKGRRKNLDLAAPTEEEAQRWVRGLAKLRERLDAMSQREKLDHWIHGYLHQADSDHNSKMSFKEIKHLLQMVNVTLDDMYAYQLFKECDSSQNEQLEGAEIEEFLRQLLKRPELEEIFNRYSGEDRVLSAAELLEFLRDQGEEGATMAHAQHLIRTYELNEKAKQHDLMMLDGFMMYLLSPDGAVLDPAHRDVYQDMNQPLSHYFISSSHNTYLTQSQIGGASSTEAYIRAFAQGCRCVELDCWEGPDGEPVVYHGHTFTSKILFRDVIQVVRDHAFLLSPYPVILSLENHCGIQQQSTMARYLRTILGNMLVTETLDGKVPKELPSPEQLKGKVLVKGKKQTVCQKEEVQYDPPEEDNENGFKLLKLSQVSLKGKSSGQQQREEVGSFSSSGKKEEDEKLLKVKSFTKRRKSSTHKLEEAVLSYIDEEGEGKEEQEEESEEEEEGEAEAEAGEYNKQGQVCFANVKQTKPEAWGSSGEEGRYRVLTAQQLPKLNREKPNSIVDPLVRVEIYGVPRDCAQKETNYVLNNGFNPYWGQTLQFTLGAPELALVRFVVEDYDITSFNDFVGQFTLPMNSLKQGYRHIHLFSKEGVSLSPATLFVHIQIKNQ
ncbi:1-phosphatidylinositol 4,5-bisphosphate phosphodiesterase delta-3 [Petaurus breviceps papuanus]|uniref:1-phosphatidylinositol 4,5-bisphosphate phosphodiesterase delta-3 n=1 Tax=Petaurus breviceps papuanus TaxID=3040969 RepID=UPI0036D7ABD4